MSSSRATSGSSSKISSVLSVLFALGFAGAAFAIPAPVVEEAEDMFYDDFSSGILDPENWYAAYKNWGGEIVKKCGIDYNGGVVPQNLYVSNSVLQCEAHGNLYKGKVKGIGKVQPGVRKDGRRVGACAVTKEYYASGSYEIRAKVAPVKGVCCALWTFEYEEYYPGDPEFVNKGENNYYAYNHEIDIEMPGRPKSDHENIGYDYALCNTWVGEYESEYTTGYTKLPKKQDDGAFHTYRFDWHTGDKAGTIRPRVEFYVDGVSVATNYTHVPTRAGRFWVGAWFPNGWAGTPEFDTSVFQVDYVKIIPFHEENDEPQRESFGTDGLVEPINIILPPVWEVGYPNASDVYVRFETGELAFRGTGAISNFSSTVVAPWSEEATNVTSVYYSKDVQFDLRLLDGLPNVKTVNGHPLSYYSGDFKYAFYDDFSLEKVDVTKWYAVNKNMDKYHTYYSGGVAPENLYVRDGVLQCEAHGSDYVGDVTGPTESGNQTNQLVGACVATRDRFASGRYEIRAKVAPVPGVCSAMWMTDTLGADIEINFQLPGRPAAAETDIGYDYALCNTLVGGHTYDMNLGYVKLAQAQNDGQFHTYRIDWHTGDEAGTIQPRVEFYVDGDKVHTSTDKIPTKAVRLWIGAWFPLNWAGTPDFDTTLFEIDYVKIIPFDDENDVPADPEVADVGLVSPLNDVPNPLWQVGVDPAWSVLARLNDAGELVFSGKGAMKGFDSAEDAPWYSVATGITAVVIRDGVTDLSQGSLAGLTRLKTVNGTALSRYSQTMVASGKSDTESYNPSVADQPTNFTVNVYQSTDLKTWTKVSSGLQLDSDGTSVKLPFDPNENQGFFKFVAE